MTWVVIASGPSLTDEDVAYVKQARDDGRIKGVIAVSNVGLDKAPWADILVSHDSAWWVSYPESLKFAGRRISRRGFRDTEQYAAQHHPQGINSGLFGMYVARDVVEAKKIILLGFDMQGSHYFGNHNKIYNHKPLPNPNKVKFSQFINQFKRFSGCEVVNCTPGSQLTRFYMAQLRAIL